MFCIFNTMLELQRKKDVTLIPLIDHYEQIMHYKRPHFYENMTNFYKIIECNFPN